MTVEGEHQSLQEETVPRSAFNSATDLLLAYRQTLRDMLYQVGIPTNPGSSDGEIFSGLAEKLHVDNKYQMTYNRVVTQREQNEASSK